MPPRLHAAPGTAIGSMRSNSGPISLSRVSRSKAVCRFVQRAVAVRKNRAGLRAVSVEMPISSFTMRSMRERGKVERLRELPSPRLGSGRRPASADGLSRAGLSRWTRNALFGAVALFRAGLEILRI